MSLHVYEAGTPGSPAIVFLHGGGMSGRMWQPQFERLSGEFYCLAPDLPEHGQSMNIPLKLEDAAQRVARVIREKVPGKRAHVVGLSLGGAITLAMLKFAPEYVDHSVVSGSTSGLSGMMSMLMKASGAFYRYMKPQKLAEAAYKQFKIPAAYHDMFVEDMIPTLTVEANNSMVQALTELKLPERTPGPLLVIVGQKETLPAIQSARRIKEVVAGATSISIPGAGHVWNLQLPDLFSDTIRAWITDQPLPQSIQPLY